jgi:putative DNA methylase
MTTAHEITPFSLKDAPSLIESVLPVQRLSIDVYKERMAGSGQTLTSLGSYWKGRKPLVLNRACVLGALLPATTDAKSDLEVFELLMSMDDDSIKKRLSMPTDAVLSLASYKDMTAKAKRAEEVWGFVHDHIWEKVNAHLRTTAKSVPQLIHQLGVMRFGHRPRVADAFSGSGQIPFEASRLGCDVYASDLNPIACLLTWGAFNIVGAATEKRAKIRQEQKRLAGLIKAEIDTYGIELDGNGWRGKAYLYCLEVLCPSSGWRVPVVSNRIINRTKGVIFDLIPNKSEKRYEINVRTGVSEAELKAAEKGTYEKETVFHHVDNVEHRNKLSSIRGDFTEVVAGKKISRNKLRQWALSDIDFRDSDIYRERLFAIHWVRDDGLARPETEYRSVSQEDLVREAKAAEVVASNLVVWQSQGLIPDMRIETGFNTKQPIWERGWTHWHHLFNPRQLLVLATCKKHLAGDAHHLVMLPAILNLQSKLCGWHNDGRKGGCQNAFSNQALNTLNLYGVRGLVDILPYIEKDAPSFPSQGSEQYVDASPASEIQYKADIFITDPPYGDAVKYEEILEFFISWLRKDTPDEFSEWVWDSRRSLAVKGEDHDFKLSMVAAYKRMAENMPENGLQIVMFTHQSEAIWADMANIVWASGLRVTAAWYVVTETDNALRDGQYVKGTILLVLRKRLQEQDTARDELAYELAEEVKNQVDLLTGLNRGVRDMYRDENLFEDADLQMAGYAAALRVLTRYSQIDGVSMTQEAMRPRVKGQLTMVDELIAFAVNIANEYLVPEGVDRAVWAKSSGIERFYLKMLDMESKGIHVLSNYQNFAKAFKVQDYSAVMDEVKANHANLKSASQLGKRGMSTSEEFGPTVLRSVLYAVHLLQENKVNSEDVLHQLRDLVPDYFRERERITALADYVSKKTAKARPDESSNAMVLRDLVRRERV